MALLDVYRGPNPFEGLQGISRREGKDLYFGWRAPVGSGDQFVTQLLDPLTHSASEFLVASQGNETIEEAVIDVSLRQGQPYWYGRDYEKVRVLAMGLGNMKSLKRVHLLLGGDFLSSFPYDFRALSLILKQVPQVESVELGYKLPDGTDHARELMECLKQLPKLKHLGFPRQDIGYSQANYLLVDQLVHQCYRMRAVASISFERSRELLPYSVFSLADMETFTDLKLFDCSVSATQCELLASSLRRSSSNLLTLDLVRCKIDPPGAQLIVEALKQQRKVKKLELSSSMLGKDTCSTLADLVFTSKSLVRLGLLRDFGQAPPGFNPEWLLPVFLGLQKTSTLRSFHLGRISWSSGLLDSFASWLEADSFAVFDLKIRSDPAVQGDVWSQLRTALTSNNGLKKLTIDGINENEAVNLARSLQSNTCLEELRMEPQSDTAEDVSHTFVRLVRAMGSNTTLKRLYCYVQDPSIFRQQQDPTDSRYIFNWKEVSAVIRKNYGLCDVEGYFMRDHISALANLIPVLQMNKAGRKYLVTDPTDKASGVKVLSAVIQDLDWIFFHLLENPGLCDATPLPVLSYHKNGMNAKDQSLERASKRKRVV